MIAYLDSSVLLRVVLGQPDRLERWNAVEIGVASGLVEVECLRTLDRLRLRGNISGEELALRREAVFRILEEMEVVDTGWNGALPGFPAAACHTGNAGRHPPFHRPAVAGAEKGRPDHGDP